MPKNEEVSLASLGIQMPYSMQAEQSVLGAALVDETVLNRLITDMEPEMFYSDQNRAIYETMRSLYTESEAVDIVTLVNALASNKTFASADDAKVYLARIAETLPSVSNVDSYFKIVKEKYQGRRLIDAARSIRNGCRRSSAPRFRAEDRRPRRRRSRSGWTGRRRSGGGPDTSP